MPVQLIVSDLDGTLFKTDHSGGISEENLQAIRAAQDRGIPFFVCTGRPITDIYARVYRYPEMADVGMAGLNGATFIRNKEGVPIFNKTMPEDVLRGCLEIISKFPVRWVLSGSLFRNGVLWLDCPTEDEMLNLGISSDTLDYAHPDDGAQWEMGVGKIQCRGKAFDPVLPELKEALLRKYPDIEARSSWNDNIEIGPAGCQKGEAIRRLGELFGVPVENIMTLGDNENDIPMLEAAGLGVCMSNGSDGAKAVSDCVVDNSDSCGVARAIRRFALDD